MKKLFYTVCILAVPCIIGLLIYQRITAEQPRQTIQNAQTIIPAPPQKKEETKETDGNFDSENEQSVLTLLSDESLISELQTDMNGDAKEDKVAAIKKLSDQFIYFVIFFYDADTKTFRRITEIKTGVTQAKSLIYDTLTVSEYAFPVIVYSGMNSDNMQVFSITAPDTIVEDNIQTKSLITIQADGQITLKNSEAIPEHTIGNYTVYAYHSDPAAPNTLNQIEKAYTWNEKKYLFEQTGEIRIPGKKIESQFLKKLQTGTVDMFQEFLSGLWYQPAAKANQNRSLFFNTDEDEIVFSVNSIQEIFPIVSVSPRRFGVFFLTKNSAISSIRRRVDIEFTGIDEIEVRVVDDISRLKIGVSSNWNGSYRKMSTTSWNTQTGGGIEEIKKILQGDAKIWKSLEGHTLSFSDTAYRYTQEEAVETGWYTLFSIKNKTILQCKNEKQYNTFFTVTLDSEDTKNQKLILTEVSVKLNDIVLTGAHPIVYE